MKKIFVYGILQKQHSSKNFDIKDDYYLGRAILPGYHRTSLTSIFKGKDTDEVIGDIFSVPDDIEENLNRFESQFGYSRETTYPIRVDDGKEFETISYLLPRRHYD